MKDVIQVITGSRFKNGDHVKIRDSILRSWLKNATGEIIGVCNHSSFEGFNWIVKLDKPVVYKHKFDDDETTYYHLVINELDLGPVRGKKRNSNS